MTDPMPHILTRKEVIQMKQEAKHIQEKKHPYTPPKLIVHGNVEDITKGNVSGTAMDAEFPRQGPAVGEFS